MKIGITGSTGLLGWHQRAYLKTLGGHDISLATRDTFKKPELLQAFVSDLDAIIHFAGVNRGSDAEVETANIDIATRLVGALQHSSGTPFLLYANSVHHEKDTPYGRSKRAVANIFREWSKQSAGGFANAILPHAFGEFGRPFYNSVVSTFCHQLAKGEAPRLIIDSDLELVHAQEVAAFCMNIISEKKMGDIRMRGTSMKVSELLARLTTMDTYYKQEIMPDFSSPFDVHLFNTFRSYLFPDYYPRTIKMFSDSRGSLFEAIKTNSGGQVFLSTTSPGITRGNHYHTGKVERFLVVRGEARIRLRKLFNNDITTFMVRGETPCYVDIPTFYTHDITNIGNTELLTLFWANEIYDLQKPDTFPEPVDSV